MFSTYVMRFSLLFVIKKLCCRYHFVGKCFKDSLLQLPSLWDHVESRGMVLIMLINVGWVCETWL